MEPTLKADFRREVGDTHLNHLGPLPQSYQFDPEEIRVPSTLEHIPISVGQLGPLEFPSPVSSRFSWLVHSRFSAQL